MNSHQRRTPGFHMRSSYPQMRIRASWQIARQRHNVRRQRGNMTGRGVKGKKGADVLPAFLPPGIFILLVYGAGGAFWSCHNPHLISKQTPPPCKACLSSHVILAALASWYQLQDVTFVFPRYSGDSDSVSVIRKGWKDQRLEALCKIQNLEAELHASPEAMQIIKSIWPDTESIHDVKRKH